MDFVNFSHMKSQNKRKMTRAN